jgi:hypothetical protein
MTCSDMCADACPDDDADDDTVSSDDDGDDDAAHDAKRDCYRACAEPFIQSAPSNDMSQRDWASLRQCEDACPNLEASDCVGGDWDSCYTACTSANMITPCLDDASCWGCSEMCNACPTDVASGERWLMSPVVV